MGSTFWTADRETPSAATAAHMADILRLSLEHNIFSSDCFDLYAETALAERVNQVQDRIQRARADEPNASQEQYLESLRRLQRTAVIHNNELRSHLHDLVRAMGFTVPEVQSEVIAPAESVNAIAGPLVPLHPTSLTDEPPQKEAPHPSSQPLVPLPSSAPQATAPQSALAKLAALARAKKDGSTAPAMPVVAKRHREEDDEQGDPPTFRRAITSSTAQQTAKDADDDDAEEDDFGVPLALVSGPPAPHDRGGPPAPVDGSGDGGGSQAKHPSQMTREEFLSQFKRAPRRGEIGQSAEEIARAEQLGYVMSGSRSKGAQMYVDRIQRQLHERDASKLQQQFRKVEDERMDHSMISGILRFIESKSRSA